MIIRDLKMMQNLFDMPLFFLVKTTRIIPYIISY